MALQVITLLCLFLIFAQICSMPTTCIIRWKLVESSHNLLEKTGGLFPLECLEENVKFTFPKSALQSRGSQQKIDVAMTVYKIMENIDSLFGNDSFPESWDQSKVENFQNIVYRLTEDNKCILKKNNWPVELSSALRSYFEKLATFLRNKDYSVCAWEVVRKELLHVLKAVLKQKPSKQKMFRL